MKRRKKKKLKLKKKFKVLLIIIFIVIIMLAIKNNKNTNNISSNKTNNIEQLLNKKSYLDNYDNSSNVDIDSSIKDVIIKYLDLYYKSMINLKSEDVTSLFLDSNSDEAYLTQKALDLLINHHKLQMNDMKLSKAKYDVDIIKVNKLDNEVEVIFLENGVIRFNYLNVDSKLIDVKNTIKLEKVNNKYKIKSLRVIQGNYVMFTNELDVVNKSSVDNLYNKYMENIKNEVSKNKKLFEEAKNKKYVTNIKCDGSYNRSDAVKYSYQYTTKRNTEYIAYDEFGGNCQNLVSQSIHAGGIPMDISGDYEWKHYGSEINERNEKIGRSTSWTGTQNFYEYIVNNKGTGICADKDINLFYASEGDVGHVGYIDYSHAVLISKVIKDRDGNVIDLLVNSNTASLENYPFLGYVYTNKRIIKILGYNK